VGLDAELRVAGLTIAQHMDPCIASAILSCMTQTTAERVRENKARRRLKRRGYELAKSRIRDPKAIGYGTFSILDERGLSPQLVATLSSIDQVEQWLEGDHPVTGADGGQT